MPSRDAKSINPVNVLAGHKWNTVGATDARNAAGAVVADTGIGAVVVVAVVAVAVGAVVAGTGIDAVVAVAFSDVLEDLIFNN